MKNQVGSTKSKPPTYGRLALTVFAAFLMVFMALAVPAQPSVVIAAPPGPRRGPHIMPFRSNGAAISNGSAPAGAHLNYYGGPVLTNMKSVDVSYGAGTYLSNNITGITDFTTQLLGSGVIDWLLEYDTNLTGGTNQHIGRGLSGGVYTITPSSANNGSSITDAQIQTELNAQILAGALPAPDANTSYAVFFRLGQTICQGTSCSLVSGGFCAYHSTFTAPNNVVATYQVLPDLTSTNGCGNSTVYGNTTSVLSHELVETITDPQVGFANNVAAPLAWYDLNNGEISDICNALQGTFTGTNNVTYTAQLQFSNIANDCIMTRAVSADFTISASPASLTIPTGGNGTSTISTTANGVAGTVSLSVSGAPAGVTTSLSPASVSAGASSTLSLLVDPGATPGTYTLTVTGTEGANSHSTTITLTIPGDFSISASPSALTINPGSTNTSNISTAVVSGPAGSISLALSGVPVGVTASLSPSTLTTGQSSVLSVSVTSSAVPGVYPLTITGTSGGFTHFTTVTVTIPGDFSIGAAPASLSMAPGGSGTTTISTAVASGAAGTISLTVSGVPAGVTASLSPTSVSAGASSTLTVNASASTAPGNYNLTITGVEGANTHSTQVTLTIQDLTRPILSLPAAITANATSPSGAVVSYTVTASDPDNTPAQLTIVCTPTSGSTFAVGTTTVNCSASDPAGNSSTGSFTVTVKGAAAQLQDLINLVNSFKLPSSLSTSLLNKLKDVQQALAAGNNATAIANLNDFINKVNNSIGKGLTSSQASQLVQAAKQIEAALGY